MRESKKFSIDRFVRICISPRIYNSDYRCFYYQYCRSWGCKDLTHWVVPHLEPLAKILLDKIVNW